MRNKGLLQVTWLLTHCVQACLRTCSIPWGGIFLNIQRHKIIIDILYVFVQQWHLFICKSPLGALCSKFVRTLDKGHLILNTIRYHIMYKTSAGQLPIPVKLMTFIWDVLFIREKWWNTESDTRVDGARVQNTSCRTV